MSETLSKGLDSQQAIMLAYDEAQRAHRVLPIGALIPVEYDSITLTYLTSGFGIGEIGTVTYFLDGNDVAMLSLAYDSCSRLISVTRI